MATVVTRWGKYAIASNVASAGSATLAALAWGTNVNALTAAASDIALFNESSEARTSASLSQVTTTVTNDTFQATGTITATGSRTIQECAVTSNTSKPSSYTVTTGASSVIGSSSNTALFLTSTGPVNNSYIQIRTEVMLITAGGGSTALTVTRGQNGSAAIATIATSDNATSGNTNNSGITNVSNGNIMVHADLAAINLNSGDSIAFTIQIQFT